MAGDDERKGKEESISILCMCFSPKLKSGPLLFTPSWQPQYKGSKACHGWEVLVAQLLISAANYRLGPIWRRGN